MNIMKFPAFFQMCQLQASTIFGVRAVAAYAHTRDSTMTTHRPNNEREKENTLESKP